VAPLPFRGSVVLTQDARRLALALPQLALESGEILAPVAIAYETWGALNAAGDNAVLLCHALTGDTHAYAPETPDDPRAGWWNPLIGPGHVFDPAKYFIICSNVLGGCYGSSGPTSPHPADSQPYRLRFPLVTVNDMVAAQHALVTHLGVQQLAVVTGGSVGGLQTLAWAIQHPEMVARAIVLAASARLGTQGVAIDDIARQAIMGDPDWQEGQYPLDQGPATGLAIARMLNMLTYTSAGGMAQRFGRQFATRASDFPQFGARFDVETYLHHQAEKLVRRFDANTYLYLSSAMDRYDAAAPYGSDAAAFARITAEVLAVGIDTDWLFPAADVRALANGIRAAGGRAHYVEIASPEGHDAFLKEWDRLDAVLRPFLATTA
jgi:homoserine O-acetyltransferase/O-succinyltransferase